MTPISSGLLAPPTSPIEIAWSSQASPTDSLRPHLPQLMEDSASSNRAYYVTSRHHDSGVPSAKVLREGRKRVRALGGPYQQIFNYKREIIGYVKTHMRCWICLHTKCSEGKPVSCWRWGILFCNDCLKEHVISVAALKRLNHYRAVKDRLELFPYHSKGTRFYFLPEVDHILRSYTGIDVKTTIVCQKALVQMIKKNQIESSQLEAHRRQVRLGIVQFAQTMWEGQDPDPDELIDAETGEILERLPRAHLSSPDTFKVFRERFAPTHELRKYLFPAYNVVTRPSMLPYDPATGWMHDPTTALKLNDFQHLTSRWISDHAENMLRRLTQWREGTYYRKGYGGYVGNWVDAAKQYHIARLEAELDSGCTVHISHAPATHHGNDCFARIRKLRMKCGLQDEGAAHMHALPQRPHRDNLITQYSLKEYVDLDQQAVDAELVRQEGIKSFNKIVRKSCVACPDTTLLFYPMGFEGLVQHMKFGHAKLFWETDDFHVIG